MAEEDSAHFSGSEMKAALIRAGMILCLCCRRCKSTGDHFAVFFVNKTLHAPAQDPCLSYVDTPVESLMCTFRDVWLLRSFKGFALTVPLL